MSPRTRRWLARIGLGFLSLVLVLSCAVMALAMNLDSSFVKRQVHELALSSAGLEVEYRDLKLDGTSGVTIEDLVVRSPAEVRAQAPELLRVKHVQASWKASELMTPLVDDVLLDGVTLTVVLDEQGRTSFDFIPSQPGDQPKPPTPLSQQAAEALRDPLPVRHVEVRSLDAALLEIDKGKLIERDTLQGLALTLKAAGSRVEVVVGAPSPQVLALKRGEQSASLPTSLRLVATPSDAEVALDVHVQQQNIAPIKVQTLARLQAHAKFDPAHAQTEVTLKQLEVADGAATSVASLIVPDRGAPRVLHAAGKADALHLLELASAWPLPLTLKSGHLDYSVDELALDRPATQATLNVEADLAGVQLRDGSLKVGNAKLSLHGKPSADGLKVDGQATLDTLTLPDTSARGVALRLNGVQAKSGAIAGDANVRFASVEAAGAKVEDGKLELHARELVPNLDLPLATKGDLRVQGEFASVTAQGAALTNSTLRAHAPLTGGAPYAIDGALESERVWVPNAVDMPLTLDFALRKLMPDLVEPARSQGEGHVELQGGALHAVIDAARRGDALDYELSAEAPQLSQLAPLVPPDISKVTPLAKMALNVKSKGSIERVSSTAPKLKEHSTIELSNGAYDKVATQHVALTVDSSGTSMRHDANADLRIEGLRVGKDALGHDHLTFALAMDRSVPSLRLELKNERLPETLLQAAVRFDRAHRALDYRVDAHLKQMQPIAALFSQRMLAGFDVEDLDLEIETAGKLTGVVTHADANNVKLAPNPIETAGGQGTVAIRGKNLRWAQGDQQVSIPTARWHAQLESKGDTRSVVSDLETDRFDAAFADTRLAITRMHDHSAVTMTGGYNGTIEHKQQITIGDVEQEIAPGYVVGDVTMRVQGKRTPDGVIKIGELRIENKKGGSTLAVEGGMEFGMDERRLSVRTDFEQDLSLVSNHKQEFEGKGKLATHVAVSSSDFKIFHAQAKLNLADATVRMPAQKIALESMDGELPVSTDFVVSEDGVDVMRGARINPYAAQRFADQHPMLNYRSFVSIKKVVTPWVSLAPFAANLEVARNIVSLSQVEMGVRKGTITGSGILEFNGEDSRIEANVRASGVMSSHDEPFDGNAALSVGIRERSVEGRADILRIGRRHLTDLLDMQDPLRADPSLNQIRTGLRFGYPDRVAISFQHGFASASVKLGGLARLIKINDVRGIPIGPLMERVINSIQPVEQQP